MNGPLSAPPSPRFAGKVALVTGASRGIGRATALRLGREGALVGVHYGTGRAQAEAVVGEIIAGGGEAFAVGQDLAQPGTAAALISAFAAELSARSGGPDFDILVNNAGIGPRAPIEEVDEATLDLVLQINLKAPFLIIKEALPLLRAGGRIVNLGSMVARTAFPDLAAYGPAKAGIEALTTLLAAHLGPRGITVNAVLPGATATDMNPGARDPARAAAIAASVALGRVGEAEDIADVICFLASDDARWITGEHIRVTGGQRL